VSLNHQTAHRGLTPSEPRRLTHAGDPWQGRVFVSQMQQQKQNASLSSIEPHFEWKSRT